jgi:fucose-1-phosphate guanylyltransferase
MQKLYDFYGDLVKSNSDDLIHLELESPSKTLWDLIVLTAINSKQKACYEKQIKMKKLQNQVPQCFNFMVFNDPDNVKIGSGGSTINVAKRLFELYGEELFKMKILLIHAGGYSQRMPSCTVLGKIFSPVPSKSEFINDIFDLKLAIYLPFTVHMEPGIFLASSDDFETFLMDEQIESGKYFGSCNNDFVLIAHKSSLQVAKDHGVYVLDQLIESNKYSIYNCKLVLQKPSIDLMREMEIPLNDKENEYVFTDSVFYFSHSITKDLIEFYDSKFDIVLKNSIEIDAYRDFLQPLGSNPLDFSKFIKSLKKPFMKQIEQDIFSEIYKLFNKRKAVVLSLNESVFYHLGTIDELFDSYLNQEKENCIELRQSLCFNPFRLADSSCYSVTLKGVVMSSRIGEKCVLNNNSIVEYCYFDDNITLILSDFCYLSNCMIKADETVSKIDGEEIFIHSKVCLHTIPIKLNESNKYVTVFFGRKDDLKKEYINLESVKFLNKVNHSEFFLSRVKLTNQNVNSIWNMKIFRAYETMTDSFLNSVKLLNFILENSSNNFFEEYFNSIDDSAEIFSLFDLLLSSNFEKMLSYRIENSLL